ncbi:hypothetical protein P3S67_003072 [Capsicum chacoense]
MGFLKILLIFIFCSFPWPSSQSNLDTYIVHVEAPKCLISTQSSLRDLESYYLSFMPKTTTISASGNEETARMIYSYHNVMKGFAARLTASQVKEMEKKPGFVSTRRQRILSLHTTHTPSFLGLQQNMGLWKDSNNGKGVIIGVIDTGISPDHPSLSDVGMPPPPAKWERTRSYVLDDGSPIDSNGHGTHTASTAAGAFVKGDNVFGNANGTAVGVDPLTHIAVYKVCNPAGECSDPAILAAIDAAIDDGVDILSISLDGDQSYGFPGTRTLCCASAPSGDPRSFHEDSTALASYSATERGIFVSVSAGNSGPSLRTVSNEAPWFLTVGASTHDRKLKVTVNLGNIEEFEGESAYHPKTFNSTFFTLYEAGKSESDRFGNLFCSPGTLTDPAIKGKIVVCRRSRGLPKVIQGKTVKDAGGVGMILINEQEDGVTKIAEAHVLPALDEVSNTDGMKILAYIKSTSNPVASITFHGTVIGDKNAPIVPSFSSRGPNVASPGILKPDLIGPGVNVLAAWPTSVDNNKNTKSTFNVISGTSMACPHLSGIAALLKCAHPDWSPAAIKSAMMTTADTFNFAKNPIPDERLIPADIFAIGARHVHPVRASDPGLIYDTPFADYVPYLCGLNYTNQEVGKSLQCNVNCLEVKSIPAEQLNYPSFSIKLGSTPQTYTRTVTNVGDAKSSYQVDVVSPKGVSVKVTPSKLNFSKLNQKLTYQVTFSNTTNSSKVEDVEGFLKWNSNRHSVRSPIAETLSAK